MRALVDTDPVFTQIRHLEDPAARREARRHNAFFTFGEGFGRTETFPDDGLPWQTTRQPVVLDAWAPTPGIRDGRFTTVMQWDSYPAREHGGRRYGMKSDSFTPFLELPRRSGETFELALGSATAPRGLLRRMGWRLRDPREPTVDPWTYQEYLRRSKAELGVAKHGYVVGRSGWFSERSAAYLASGRPVVVQDTGFSDRLPVGRGVLAFDDLEGALAGVAAVDADYRRHCAAAREIAEQYFYARRILPALVERAMAEAT